MAEDLKKRLSKRKAKIKYMAKSMDEGVAEGPIMTKKYAKEVQEARKLKR